MTREEAKQSIEYYYCHTELLDEYGDYCDQTEYEKAFDMAIEALSSSEKPNKWIPVSERLPGNTEPVNITWVNHNPESYYTDIKDKPFTATGHYCKGKWYWYSSTCQDYLDEYGRCDVDAIDDDIEVIAWQPLPEPYKAEKRGKRNE